MKLKDEELRGRYFLLFLIIGKNHLLLVMNDMFLTNVKKYGGSNLEKCILIMTVKRSTYGGIY
jgi:hypothetical protein